MKEKVRSNTTKRNYKEKYKIILDIIENGHLVKNDLINYKFFKDEYLSYVKRKDLGNSFLCGKF